MPSSQFENPRLYRSVIRVRVTKGLSQNEISIYSIDSLYIAFNMHPVSVAESLNQVVLDFESKMRLGVQPNNSEIKPNRNRYIPPARRRSPTGQPISSLSRTLSLSPDPVKEKMERIAPSFSSYSRTPSPKNANPPVVEDKGSGDLVEVWQGKRRGGNRAPKIEPVGTKSWRNSPKSPHSPEPRYVEITNPAQQPNQPLQVLRPLEMPFMEIMHSSQREREMAFHRLLGYSSDVLNAIDIQLNVINRCIAPTSIVRPEGLELSVRFIPNRVRSILENGGITPEVLYVSREMILPGWITTEDFYNILLSILKSLEITLPELEYLLRCEEEFGDWTWKDTTDINEMLYSLAVSQINCKCSLDLSRIRHFGDDDDRRKAYFNRDTVRWQEVANVQNYVAKENSRGWKGFEQDVDQLKQDYASGRIDHKDLKLWFRCLECHWNGPVQGILDYVKILHMAGYGPGIRGPIQLPNPKESPWIYEYVKVWLERTRAAEYNYSKSQYQSPSPMINHIYEQPSWSSG